MIVFSDLSIGTYFSMNHGLLFRKISATKAVDVWSGRKIAIKPETECYLMKGDKNENHQARQIKRRNRSYFKKRKAI